MPKIIPDVRNRILASARRQLIESGFNGLSLRGVAVDCNIAVGTTYNYFSSKADLANAVMEMDWEEAVQQAPTKKGEAASAPEGVCAIYRAIREFIARYSTVIDQERSSTSSRRKVESHHQKLTSQIKEVLKDTLQSFGYEETDSCLMLEAELILAASLSKDTQEADFADLTRRVIESSKVRVNV